MLAQEIRIGSPDCFSSWEGGVWGQDYASGCINNQHETQCGMESFKDFNCITVLEAPYHSTSVKGGTHTPYTDSSYSHAFTKIVLAQPLTEAQQYSVSKQGNTHDGKIINLYVRVSHMCSSCSHLIIFMVAGSYFSSFTPMTNMGASAEGAEMTTFLAPPFR